MSPNPERLLRAAHGARWLRCRRSKDDQVCLRSGALPSHALDDARDGAELRDTP